MVITCYALVHLFGLFRVNVLYVLGGDACPYGIGRNDGLAEYRSKIEYGKAEKIYYEPAKKKSVCLLAVGSMVAVANDVRNMLKKDGINVSLINMRFVKPFDKEAVLEAAGCHNVLVTMEENVVTGGFGEHVLEMLNEEKKVPGAFVNISLPDRFLEHGKCDILMKVAGIDAESVYKKIKDCL